MTNNTRTGFEGVMDVRKIDDEHYAAVAEATALMLATEIARRLPTPTPITQVTDTVTAAKTVLLDWFTGRWKPGGPTDPADGAPELCHQCGRPYAKICYCPHCGFDRTQPAGYDTTHERDIDLGTRLDRLLDGDIG